MLNISRFFSVAVLACGLGAGVSVHAFAQAPVEPVPKMHQVALTEKQIQNLLAAKEEMNAITDKLPDDSAGKPDPNVEGDLETVAKRHGFADYDEYSDVVSNVTLVLSGIDPKTKTFSEPPAVLRKQIADLTADQNVPAPNKKKSLDDLNETLKYNANVQYPDNIVLVTKYYDRLNAALNEAE